MMSVEYPPGLSIPPHRHSVPGLCYVIEGTAETQYEGEDAKLVQAGKSFQDQANKTHVIFRNADKSTVLRFICSFKIRKDQEYVLR